MSKTQFIAIRAVLGYEMEERPDDKALIFTVNFCLNSSKLSDTDRRQAQAFVEGATKTGLDNAAMIGGLAALVGLAAVETIIMPVVRPL